MAPASGTLGWTEAYSAPDASQRAALYNEHSISPSDVLSATPLSPALLTRHVMTGYSLGLGLKKPPAGAACAAMRAVKWFVLVSHLTTSHLTNSSFCARLGQSGATRMLSSGNPQVFEIQFPLDKISRLRVPGYVKRKDRLSSGTFQVFCWRRTNRLEYCVAWAAAQPHTHTDMGRRALARAHARPSSTRHNVRKKSA